jgi:WD40 repeat protein
MQLRNLGLGHASPPHQKNSLTRSKLTDSGTKHDSAALEQSFVGGKQELPKTVMRRLAKHHSSEIYQIAQTLNGNLVATCGGDRTIRFYDPLNQVTTGVIESQKSDQVFVSVDFAPFANLLAAGSTDKQLSIYDYMTFKLKVSLLGHSGVVDAVSFASDKDKCVSSGTDRTVRVWDINRGVQLKQITPRSSAHTVDCFASEPLFASGHQDGIVRVYSLREERSEPVYQFKEKGEVFEGQITCVTLSNDGNYILASS